jgi:tetratricopeptide (TPR) repeat protein
MKTTVNNLKVLGLTALITVAGLTGCQSRDQYRKEARASSESRLAQIKSGVEWQTAERQFLSGDLDKALRTIERAIAINPRVGKSHMLKGRILMEMAQYEGATEALLTAEELDATSVETQYFLGIVAERTSRFEDALQRYTRAATLDVTNPQHILAAAEMSIQLGRIEAGEQLLRDNMKRHATSAGLRHTLGQIALIRGRLDEAANCFSEARLLAPEDQVIIEDLARVQMAQRKYGDAELSLSVLLTDPKNSHRTDLSILHVRCLAAMERLGEARAKLVKLLDDPTVQADTAAWVLMGNLAARLDDLPRLRQSVQRILANAPDRPEGHALRAMMLRSMGRLADAKGAVDTALTINPNDPEQWVLRGLIQAEMGEFADSRASLVNAQKLQPTNRNAATLIAVVNQLATAQQATVDAAPASADEPAVR